MICFDMISYTLWLHYIYMIITYDCLFFTSSFMWLDSVVAGAGALSSLSWSLSCPFHCGPSFLLPALLGFLLGLVCGLCLAVGFWAFLRPSLDFAPSPATPDLGFPGPLRHRGSSRARGYLHEWPCLHGRHCPRSHFCHPQPVHCCWSIVFSREQFFYFSFIDCRSGVGGDWGGVCPLSHFGCRACSKVHRPWNWGRTTPYSSGLLGLGASSAHFSFCRSWSTGSSCLQGWILVSCFHSDFHALSARRRLAWLENQSLGCVEEQQDASCVSCDLSPCPCCSHWRRHRFGCWEVRQPCRGSDLLPGGFSSRSSPTTMQKVDVRFASRGDPSLLVWKVSGEISHGGGEIQAFVIPLMARAGGMLLAVPQHVLSDSALMDAAFDEEGSVLGPSREFSAELIAESDEGNEFAVGIQQSFIVVDVVDQILEAVREYDPVTDSTEEIVCFSSERPDALVAVGDLLPDVNSWLENITGDQGRLNFYSAREEQELVPAPKPKKSATKKVTTAVLAEQMSAVMAQLQFLTSQQEMMSKQQGPFADHVPGHPLGATVAPKLPNVSAGAKPSSPTTVRKALSLVGPPPKTRGILEAEDVPGAAAGLESAGALPGGGGDAQASMVAAINQQSMALTSLVAHLASGDALGDLQGSSSSTSVSTKGVMRREKMQQELAGRTSQFSFRCNSKSSRRCTRPRCARRRKRSFWRARSVWPHTWKSMGGSVVKGRWGWWCGCSPMQWTRRLKEISMPRRSSLRWWQRPWNNRCWMVTGRLPMWWGSWRSRLLSCSPRSFRAPRHWGVRFRLWYLQVGRRWVSPMWKKSIYCRPRKGKFVRSPLQKRIPKLQCLPKEGRDSRNVPSLGTLQRLRDSGDVWGGGSCRCCPVVAWWTFFQWEQRSPEIR